ncbi:MAG TPA: ornithine carbamoyltransferase [Acidimicrobiales bacterium]|nr:ornithine carbamoyltransferase [Acidimicrobiales bacterium]
MTRHLLSVADLSAGELTAVLDLAALPEPPSILRGKGAALVFEHPSARTRNAAELAVVQLGGHPVTMRGEEVGIDRRETAEDVARTLACFHAVVAARVAAHGTLERMAAALDASGVGVPVVNLLSDREHPTQAVADLLTIRQHLGVLAGRVIAYVGDGNNVCRSLVLAAALAGVAVHVAAPPGYGLSPADLRRAEELGGSVRTHTVAAEAVAEADVVYTDVWTSMGQDAEREARLAAFRGFTVDGELLDAAPPRALVMHCLPAHRGEEISAAVLEERSVVWQQAENRMHALRGILLFLLGQAEPGPGQSGAQDPGAGRSEP